MNRYLIIYKGIVQGVGFRWRILQIANELNVTGYVTNKLDGSVLVEVQGNKEEIKAFLAKSLSLHGFVQIEDYSTKQIDVINDERTFTVR